MHPYQHAQAHPDKPAFVIADKGVVLTYGQLDPLTNRGAQLFRKLGLKPGDVVAVMLKNVVDYPVVYWSSQRAGTMMTPISSVLKPAEAAYIVKDCGAKVLITGADVGDTARILAADRENLIPGVKVYYAGGEPLACARKAPWTCWRC